MKPVLTGSDVLAANNFAELAGLHIGFVGNHTARMSDGTPTYVALHQASNCVLERLFSPEHGAFGSEDREDIGDDIDPVTGLPILSLYGTSRKPTPDMLTGLDALVFEIQDIGARFYTYSSTLLLCLEAAREAGINFIVLDRPNPITGRVEGPLPDPDKLSFVVSYNMPVRHGLTMGELAIIACKEQGYGDTVRVIQCEGLTRSTWWDQTGLPWINPSPAMRSPEAALLYPGVCLLEQTNISVGRGTETPFLVAGAPWIDAAAWAESINTNGCDGVVAEPHEFTPKLRQYESERCHGVRLAVVERKSIRPVRIGIAMIAALRDIHDGEFQIEKVNHLLANDSVMEMLRSGKSVDSVCGSWLAQDMEWENAHRAVRLY